MAVRRLLARWFGVFDRPLAIYPARTLLRFAAALPRQALPCTSWSEGKAGEYLPRHRTQWPHSPVRRSASGRIARPAHSSAPANLASGLFARRDSPAAWHTTVYARHTRRRHDNSRLRDAPPTARRSNRRTAYRGRRPNGVGLLFSHDPKGKQEPIPLRVRLNKKGYSFPKGAS